MALLYSPWPACSWVTFVAAASVVLTGYQMHIICNIFLNIQTIDTQWCHLDWKNYFFYSQCVDFPYLSSSFFCNRAHISVNSFRSFLCCLLSLLPTGSHMLWGDFHSLLFMMRFVICDLQNITRKAKLLNSGLQIIFVLYSFNFVSELWSFVSNTAW